MHILQPSVQSRTSRTVDWFRFSIYVVNDDALCKAKGTLLGMIHHVREVFEATTTVRRIGDTALARAAFLDEKALKK